MPRKIKNHLINYLRVTDVYVVTMGGLVEGNILMSLASDSDPLEKLQTAVNMFYAVYVIWFCWRFYTGVFRDGDFWADDHDDHFI